MPHLIIEYSSDLDAKIDFVPLLSSLSHRLVELGPFDLQVVRTRATRFEKFTIAAEPGRSFLHLTVLILSGRPLETRKAVSQGLLEHLVSKLSNQVPKNCSLTVELREMERETYSKTIL